MFEIFKTNIEDRETAAKVLSRIGEVFTSRPVNIDLEDCDRILRIPVLGEPERNKLIILLDSLGIEAALIE